jgi:hypothetical protein
VFDSDRFGDYATVADNECMDTYLKRLAQQPPVEESYPAECDSRQVRNLRTEDFRLFEDGKEQKISTVTLEAHMSGVSVRDNLGKHTEFVFTPRGIWSASDTPWNYHEPPMGLYGYVISYVPPHSPVGSCHKIKVTVDRHNSYVFTRSDYCNFPNLPYDPLNGTAISRKMEQVLAPGRKGEIPLSVQTGIFYETSSISRIQISTEFPWKALKRSTDSQIAILGVATKKDGSLSVRFSDSGCCSSNFPYHGGSRAGLAKFDSGDFPARYDTQMDLPVGDYNLSVILTDGRRFGRADISVNVNGHKTDQLEISSIVLCKRFHEAVEIGVEPALRRAPQYVRLTSKNVEFTPAGDTRFQKDDPLIAYFEVYDPISEKLPKSGLRAKMSVVDARTGDMKIDFEDVSLTPYLQSPETTVRVARQLTVNKLPAGSYRLELRVSDGASVVTDTSVFAVY